MGLAFVSTVRLGVLDVLAHFHVLQLCVLLLPQLPARARSYRQEVLHGMQCRVIEWSESSTITSNSCWPYSP
jgi:hypothetical protein